MLNTKKGAAPENKPQKPKKKNLSNKEKSELEAKKIEFNDATSESDS